jgi:hypothetical protein
VFAGRVCPAAGCKTNFQICIEVTVATAHPTRNLVEFQHPSAGHTRPTYPVCGLLNKRISWTVKLCSLVEFQNFISVRFLMHEFGLPANMVGVHASKNTTMIMLCEV